VEIPDHDSGVRDAAGADTRPTDSLSLDSADIAPADSSMADADLYGTPDTDNRDGLPRDAAVDVRVAVPSDAASDTRDAAPIDATVDTPMIVDRRDAPALDGADADSLGREDTSPANSDSSDI
jgi:hypothetical protein